jgi:hypothetical protein
VGRMVVVGTILVVITVFIDMVLVGSVVVGAILVGITVVVGTIVVGINVVGRILVFIVFVVSADVARVNESFVRHCEGFYKIHSLIRSATDEHNRLLLGQWQKLALSK